MQIVIELPKKLCNEIKQSYSIRLGEKNTDKILKAISNGTILPEQARIIDMDKLAITPIDVTDLPYNKCLMVYYPEDLDEATILEGSVNK